LPCQVVMDAGRLHIERSVM